MSAFRICKHRKLTDREIAQHVKSITSALRRMNAKVKNNSFTGTMDLRT